MALFLVEALKESAPEIEIAITAKLSPENYYKIEHGKWIVDAGAVTAKDLSVAVLEIPPAAWHMIIGFRGYYGRAQPSMWEWIAAKSAKG